MHVSQRDALILSLVTARGFVSFRELESRLDASPATIRRDLERLALENKLLRVRGGVKSIASGSETNALSPGFHLAGVPFHDNIGLNRAAKAGIGRAAAALCEAGEGVMIDGGSTTLQMCPHLSGLNLSVLTNSLHIVSALINQPGTRVLVPSGAVFPEQSIILSIFGEEGMPKFHAPKLFMGAASIGPAGVMQADPLLVAAERRLIERAEKIILMVDATKFGAASGNVVCALSDIDVVITDDRIEPRHAEMIRNAGATLQIIAEDGLQDS